MTVGRSFRNTKRVVIPEHPLPVEETSGLFLQSHLPGTELSNESGPANKPGDFRLATLENSGFSADQFAGDAPEQENWVYIRLVKDGSGELIASEQSLLYAFTSKLIEDCWQTPVKPLRHGKYQTSAFRWHRPLYDYLLTQVWRNARNFDSEAHVREMARTGYTHAEVNGMAPDESFEESVGGEFYAHFYSYGLALDQYVNSSLNRGLYPADYLQANLKLLKHNARIAVKYGLRPGILCFEPRSVPERFFDRYPTLRGARVDHPFRSRKPRYSLSTAHPRVKAHYQEMIQKLLHEVPDLAYMSIWSNDSGAGFEHTSSLYVGRNGGPYLIREWRTHDQIAEIAGRNVVDFMLNLRDAAAKINPDFRVSLRLEPFKVEHEVITGNLKQNLDVEVPSLLVQGYDLPYAHPKYPDIGNVAGTVHHNQLASQERRLLQNFKSKGHKVHLMYSQGNGFNFEPLLGLPFPWLLHEKLQAMAATGAEYVANLGGAAPSSFAPYHINRELFRAFMLNPYLDADAEILKKASKWAGKSAESLVDVWRNAEEAIRWLPALPLYSGFGFVWLRLWVRPIIPDLLAVPTEDRQYYEKFMVSSDNNTNLTDLGRDVLFDLVSQESGAKYVERVDKNVWRHLDQAIAITSGQADNRALPDRVRSVFIDQRDRLKALRCWIGTLRSVAAWCAGVYAYLGSDDSTVRKKWRKFLDDMVDLEIENAKNLLQLWETSDVEFMFISGSGETPFIYGENFGELLRRKIDLMEKYRDVEPRIDHDIIWRV